ncbi:DUF4386 domain-containing protein [Saccharothrix sp. Mg75]|uniref:DUF4386 domain-containing protein n=1 Tax=Saccharothrix sp. Mg75 TaxID=3445357 RepID=UPI003EEDFBFA
MTPGARTPPAPRQTGDGSIAAAPVTAATRSIRNAAIAAGTGLLLMAALAGFAKVFVLDGLLTRGDAGRTAAGITESGTLFRLGVTSLFLVVALDVVVAWGLYRVLSAVDRNTSMVAAAFRLVYAGVFMVAIARLLGAVRLLGDGDHLGVLSVDQRNAQVMLEVDAFYDLWAVALVLFGAHLVVVGYLAHRSGFMPKVLGALVVIAGLGYLVDSFGVMLTPHPWPDIATYTFVGEFLLALWLVIRGRRLTAGALRRREDPVTTAR